MRFGMFVAVVALGSSVVACGPDCAALCEDAKDCEGAEQAEGGDCEKSCEEAEKKAEAAGCESQYEEALSCRDDQDDVCDLSGCAKEETALLECVEK
jgi:hypothetical protein